MDTKYIRSKLYLFSQKGGLQEWSIVELQGDLEVRGSQDMKGQFIGDLSYDKYGQPVRPITCYSFPFYC